MKGPLAQRLSRMPRYTDNLRADHSVVCLGLDVLGAIGEHVRGGGDLPAEDTATLLRFLREFLLATHFRKENEHLWPALAMRGDEASCARIGDLLRMQDEVTDLVHSLVMFWEPVSELTSAEREGFAEAIAMLLARMHRMRILEEEILFRVCDATVPADDQLDWGPAFAQLEAGRVPRQTWVAQIQRLAQTWVA
jgi:hemerythrin-like domain-containing protein